MFIADVSECDLSNGGCDLSCINTVGSYSCECSDRLALFPGSPSPFLTFFLISRVQVLHEGEGEPGMELCLPMASYGHGHSGNAFHCAQYHSCAALWIVMNFAKRSQGLQSRPVENSLRCKVIPQNGDHNKVINKEV